MTAGAWVRASPVAARLAAARSRLPAGALELACHAAVPVAVDAGLLHLLRINFFLDPPAVLPYEAEAALLLSPLFREVGEDLYEIDPPLRDALLTALVAGFGPERPARVALLLEQYTDQHPAWHTQPELEHAQRLTALNLVDPSRATDWLAANRTSAGGPALTREWFVAMTDRLRPRASLQDRLADALAAADAASHDLRLAAITELGELAMLPGADVRAIALQLERSTRIEDAELRALAGDVLSTVTHLVPPPPPRRPVEAAADGYGSLPFPQLYGIDPATFDPERAWAAPGNLTVPIGTDPDGRPVLLDLREPGHGGMGPHGLIVGTTGSGKSELVRSLILGLAVTNSPAELHILPVNFHGGDTFAGLESLPHLAGMATGLGEDFSLLERFMDVIAGEITRRQQPATDRRAHLLVVVDEFTDLLAANPAVLDTFLTLGRVGRSLGIHLLLTSQRLEEGRLRGLDTHLSIRIGLRTAWTSESRTVLGVPDAAELPHGPGHGYLRTRDDDLRRFRGTPVSGPFPPPPPSWSDVLDPFAARHTATLLQLLVERMAGHGGPVHQIWLPPLSNGLALGDLPRPPEEGWIALGEVDVPRDHGRAPYFVDLTGSEGHVAIAGAPGSGKVTALRTIVTAIARSGRAFQVYCIGGELSTLAGLPYVGGVYHRDDRGAIADLISFLLHRPANAGPTAVLVVVGWSRTLEEHPDLDQLVFAGKAVIVASTDLLRNIGADYLPAFGTLVELRLTDPGQSYISRLDARQVPFLPGRGIVVGGHQIQVAKPVRAAGGGHEDYVRDLAMAWTGPRAPRPEPNLRVRLGAFEDDDTEFAVDFAADPHLLILGDADSAAPLLGRIARSVDGATVGPDLSEDIARTLRTRLPGPTVTPDQLRRRSWWSGPDLWVHAVEDLDALGSLVEFLIQAKDLGFHLVVAMRRTHQSMSHPVVRRLLDVDTTMIQIMGDPRRGSLIGRGELPRLIRFDDTYDS